MILAINTFNGMNVQVSPEKLPPWLFQKVVNLKPAELEGLLRKRGGYASLVSSGLTSLQNMIEFVDANESRQILLLDGTTLEEIAYSAGYGSPASISNDERTGSSTVNTFHPVNYNGVVRSGAGVNASTDMPFWYGYIPERDRFNGATTISAGKYLEDSYYAPGGTFETMIKDRISLSAEECYVSDKGFATDRQFRVFVAPQLDGFQRGFPVDCGVVSFSTYTLTTRGSLAISISILAADLSKLKRLTGLYFFVQALDNEKLDSGNDPLAYFLEFVDLDDDGNQFLTLAGDVGTVAANDITIQASGHGNINTWLTFNPNGYYINNGATYYRATNHTINSPVSGDLNIEVTPAAGAVGASTALQVRQRWYDDGAGNKVFQTFYDNHYKKLGTEMYTYLGLPPGGEAVSDFRYKYGAVAAKRQCIVGFTGERALFGNYSTEYDLDVFPVQNEFKLRYLPRALASIADEAWIVFYKHAADRVDVYGNENHRMTDNFLTVGCVGQQALCELGDLSFAWMSYNGPQLVYQGQFVEGFSEALREWWIDTLTDAQKEACVVGYNWKSEEIWFSFPTYTTSPYTAGIVFVFDMRAWKQRKASAWWLLHTDVPIYAATLADDQHFLTASRTVIHDWNNASPTESFDCSLKLKVLRNRAFNRRMNLNRLIVDFEDAGDNSLTANLYLERSGTATATVTFTESTPEKLMEYIGEELEIEITTDDGTDSVDIRGIILDVTEMTE